MAQETIDYNGVAGSICSNCSTILLVIVTKAEYVASITHCPTVTTSGFFCEAPLLEMDEEEIDSAMQSYYDLNLAGNGVVCS